MFGASRRKWIQCVHQTKGCITGKEQRRDKQLSENKDMGDIPDQTTQVQALCVCRRENGGINYDSLLSNSFMLVPCVLKEFGTADSCAS
jgi:hypothetical protein